MKIIKGGVTAPQGYKASGLWCGIKRSGKLDLALITSDIPSISVGLFTKNSVKAAPLRVSQQHLRNARARAIVVNSGNANCFTGRFGLIYAQKTTELIGRLLDIPASEVIVSSTGIIGKPLPFGKIEEKAEELVQKLSKKGSLQAAKAIMTTDTKPKEIAVEISLGGKKVKVGAMAKGSGMIAPDMATMLAFITTDAAISPQMLKAALVTANGGSFGAITVDACMSTNDMVTLTANGLAGNRSITRPDKDFKTFADALSTVCLDLAKKIVLDGEGATKFIEIQVKGAETIPQARKIGLAVANSNLVKTAAFASDPNWGRVAAAVGSLGIKRIQEENLKISFSSFKKKHITIHVELDIGTEAAVVYASDLSYEYVRINGEYT